MTEKMLTLMPQKCFFVKGVGYHKDKLASFEAALRDAGIEKFNLVYISSIFPPQCKTVNREEALEELRPGQLVFCVMARIETNEPNRLLSAAIGLALPKDRNKHHGYISEHHAFGEGSKVAGEYAEDLAATMLATTLGIPFDPDKAWDERKQIYKSSGHIFTTHYYSQSAKGHKQGLWTTVVVSAVFIC
jgi:arginine decarboxylase